MADVLNVLERNEIGKLRMRRMRATGKVPAVLYGHGQESKNLTVDLKELESVFKHSGHFVNLKGAVDESALIKEVQFDHFEQIVLHVDLFRVDVNEKVEVEVGLEFKGSAKGTTQGGVVQAVLHEVSILCPAFAIPDKIIVKINDLELNGAIRASDLDLPANAELVTPAETMLVHCVKPVEEAETTDVAAEPELVGKKPEGGDDDK